MCKLIAELVGADRQIIREVVGRLEKASGLPGIDVRLTGEIYGQTHMKMRELGLDPNDTTAKELYQALLNLADLHDQFLAKSFGIDNRQNVEDVLRGVTHVVNKLHIARGAWAIKSTTIKRLLKAAPPKQLMKALHYRSFDSMIRREPPRLLLNMARHVESDAWQQKFLQLCSKLSSADFEQRDVEVKYLDELKWSAVIQQIAHKHHTNIFVSSESATIFITPLPARGKKGLTLATTMMTLHYVNEIRTHSSYLKFHHFTNVFGKKLHTVLQSPQETHAVVAGQPIPWRVVHRYYGTTTRVLHPEVFEPHIQPEDLSYRKAENILYRLEPALYFWRDLDYVGVDHGEHPISFNLMDVALNLLNDVSYENRLAYHLRDALWNELLIRYVGKRPLERQLLQHLDDQVVYQTDVISDMEFVL